MFDWFLKKGNLLIHYDAVSVDQLGIVGSINDIAITSRDSFYVTNDKFWVSWFGRIGHFTGLPLNKLVYYNKGKAMDVSRGYIEPNGIALSPSGERLFFTDTMSNTFYEFKVSPTTGELDLLTSKGLNTGSDNIEVISENEILIGCHYRLHELFPYFFDIENSKSASHVIRLWRSDVTSEWNQQDLFMDDGSLISGSSVAVYGAQYLYICTVVEKIAICKK